MLDLICHRLMLWLTSWRKIGSFNHYHIFTHISSHTLSFFFTEIWCPAKGEDCIIQVFYWCSYTVCNTHPTYPVSGFDWFPRCKVRCGCNTMFFLKKLLPSCWGITFKHGWFILHNMMFTSYTAFFKTIPSDYH